MSTRVALDRPLRVVSLRPVTRSFISLGSLVVFGLKLINFRSFLINLSLCETILGQNLLLGLPESDLILAHSRFPRLSKQLLLLRVIKRLKLLSARRLLVKICELRGRSLC